MFHFLRWNWHIKPSFSLSYFFCVFFIRIFLFFYKQLEKYLLTLPRFSAYWIWNTDLRRRRRRTGRTFTRRWIPVNNFQNLFIVYINHAFYYARSVSLWYQVASTLSLWILWKINNKENKIKLKFHWSIRQADAGGRIGGGGTNPASIWQCLTLILI